MKDKSSNKFCKDFEELAMEVVEFCRNWGLLRDTSIITNGNMYSFPVTDGAPCKRLDNGIQVEFRQGVSVEDYTSGICDDGRRRSFANPEHLFDMTYEGPLYNLLRHGEYEVRKSDISEEAWEIIFSKTYILDDYIYEKYEIVDANDLLDHIIWSKLDNPENSSWDPLVFDTWEEYIEFIGGEEDGLTPNYTRYDTYEEYEQDIEYCDYLTVDDVKPLWDKMVDDAKQEFLRECADSENEIISIPELADYVQSELRKIFEKHGLWYDFGFGWSLTCYRQ